jgi:hypothetical protein
MMHVLAEQSHQTVRCQFHHKYGLNRLPGALLEIEPTSFNWAENNEGKPFSRLFLLPNVEEIVNICTGAKSMSPSDIKSYPTFEMVQENTLDGSWKVVPKHFRMYLLNSRITTRLMLDLSENGKAAADPVMAIFLPKDFAEYYLEDIL